MTQSTNKEKERKEFFKERLLRRTKFYQDMAFEMGKERYKNRNTITKVGN